MEGLARGRARKLSRVRDHRAGSRRDALAVTRAEQERSWVEVPGDMRQLDDQATDDDAVSPFSDVVLELMPLESS